MMKPWAFPILMIVMLATGSSVRAQDRIACCFADNGCRYLSQEDCLSQGGAPQGPSSDCSEGTICCPKACCVPNEGCAERRLNECIRLGGTFIITDSICNPASCAPLQACCYDGGFCLESHPDLCETLQGSPQGAGTSCDSTGCPTPQPGACCFPDGLCEEPLSFLDCVALLGRFQGSNSRCHASLCEIHEACCLPDGNCREATARNCASLGGTTMGTGVDCDTTTCPSPMAACCLPDNTCEEMLASECTDRQGAPQGAGSRCADIQCEPEACCFGADPCLGLSCVQLLPHRCVASGGQPLGVGYDCDEGCSGNGVITPVTPFGGVDPVISDPLASPSKTECGCGTGTDGLMLITAMLAFVCRFKGKTARSSRRLRTSGTRRRNLFLITWY